MAVVWPTGRRRRRRGAPAASGPTGAGRSRAGVAAVAGIVWTLGRASRRGIRSIVTSRCVVRSRRHQISPVRTLPLEIPAAVILLIHGPLARLSPLDCSGRNCSCCACRAFVDFGNHGTLNHGGGVAGGGVVITRGIRSRCVGPHKMTTPDKKNHLARGRRLRL